MISAWTMRCLFYALSGLLIVVLARTRTPEKIIWAVFWVLLGLDVFLDMTKTHFASNIAIAAILICEWKFPRNARPENLNLEHHAYFFLKKFFTFIFFSTLVYRFLPNSTFGLRALHAPF